MAEEEASADWPSYEIVKEKVDFPREHLVGGYAEIESSLVDHSSVAEAAVVGANDDTTGQAIVGYVILRGGNEPSPELTEEIRQHVATKLGPIARPKAVFIVPDLPKTRSGKIMRRLLRDVAEGRDLGDTTTLADASVVDEIRTRAADSDED